MGKKYIIELEDKPLKNYGNNAIDLYRVKGFNSLVFDSTGLSKLEEYKESKGTSDAEEAWKFAAKVFGSDSGCMTPGDMCGCFKTDDWDEILHLSYSEVKRSYDKWVAEKKARKEREACLDLNVGDVLVNRKDGSVYFIHYVDDDYYHTVIVGKNQICEIARETCGMYYCLKKDFLKKD